MTIMFIVYEGREVHVGFGFVAGRGVDVGSGRGFRGGDLNRREL
jgi:hypothetical protein